MAAVGAVAAVGGGDGLDEVVELGEELGQAVVDESVDSFGVEPERHHPAADCRLVESGPPRKDSFGSRGQGTQHARQGKGAGPVGSALDQGSQDCPDHGEHRIGLCCNVIRSSDGRHQHAFQRGIGGQSHRCGPGCRVRPPRAREWRSRQALDPVDRAEVAPAVSPRSRRREQARAATVLPQQRCHDTVDRQHVGAHDEHVAVEQPRQACTVRPDSRSEGIDHDERRRHQVEQVGHDVGGRGAGHLLTGTQQRVEPRGIPVEQVGHRPPEQHACPGARPRR